MTKAVQEVDKILPRSVFGNNAEYKYEPIRDWSFGWISGHRIRVVVFFLGNILLFYGLQHLLWTNTGQPVSWYDQVWSWFSLLWLAAVPVCIMVFVGLLMYRHPTRLDEVHSVMRTVVFRIVTRGDNVDALIRTVRRIQHEMRHTPLFPYVIEVVTDSHPILLTPPSNDVRYIVVPKNYYTKQGTRFKARALEYALWHSVCVDTDWIVHLDEETQPTTSGIKGICRAIIEEERSQKLRIGQGAMLYHRQWETHPFLTLADNVRTGMDFGPFYVQAQLGISLVGFHGSYILVRNDVEKAVGGFDFGPAGDITEDAYWILIANARGHRIRWVEGYLEEQSTQSLLDFIRQRRRWFEGLVRVIRFAPVPLRWRLGLGTMLTLWGVTSLSILYSVAHIFYGFENRSWIRFGANFSWSVCATMYLIGLKVNMDEYGITNRLERVKWYVIQLVCIPVFCLMEIVSALSALIRPHGGFHVVLK